MRNWAIVCLLTLFCSLWIHTVYTSIDPLWSPLLQLSLSCFNFVFTYTQYHLGSWLSRQVLGRCLEDCHLLQNSTNSTVHHLVLVVVVAVVVVVVVHVVTLCAYAQQGYAFGRVGWVCVRTYIYIYIYISTKKQAV